MKYNLNINQVRCQEWGLNLQQGIMMDIFSDMSSWAEATIIWEDIFYYFSAWKIIKEVPIITDKKNTILKIIKQLKEKDLVEHILYNNKWYYRLTGKWKTYKRKWNIESEGVEKNPQGCGKKSTLGVEKNPHNNNTSYNNTNIRESNNTLYGEFENVSLSKEQSEKLSLKFWKSISDKYIEDLSSYIETNPTKWKKYKSHYATLTTWMRRDNISPVRNNNIDYNKMI